MKSLKVNVDIEHTYLGDLIVILHAPTNMGVDPVILHERQGGAADNLKQTYDEAIALPDRHHSITCSGAGLPG